MMSKFSTTPDKDYVIRVASTLKLDDSATFEDNGITQSVTLKASASLPEVEQLKPIVQLAPFRTFPEVGQPINDFLFRVNKTPSGPGFVLYEANGGKWKLDAINEIRRYLSVLNLGIPIIA